MSVLFKIFNISIAFSLSIMLIFSGSCQENNEESARNKAIQFLASDKAKNWIIERSTLNDIEVIQSSCDSAYVLTLQTDFTWRELYLIPNCSFPGNGSWELNDENNVLSISYLDPVRYEVIEKHFEIEELSDEYFAYQIAVNNKLKFVRLRRRD